MVESVGQPEGSNINKDHLSTGASSVSVVMVSVTSTDDFKPIKTQPSAEVFFLKESFQVCFLRVLRLQIDQRITDSIRWFNFD